ncbi:MAG: M1 family metallopeptidase [Candidatus Paceibacterota bacterium]|jgi:puromycin-sensitive aminopeptidase
MKTKHNKKSVHLDDNISPTSYNLTLHPDLLSSTFSGSEIIKIKVNKEIKQITLHSKDIDIETVMHIAHNTQQFAYKITYDTERETVTFHFKNKIAKGQSELSIVFSGIINDSLRGFYKSRYVLDGEEKFIATTQFEATDARRAFPCFDEPAHKAIFEVSLVIPENHTAISNTLPINIREHSAGYKIVSFSPTPIMSTYLLAFIIGEFEYVEGYTCPNGSSRRTKEKVQVRVFTTPGKKHQAKFALEVAIKSLEFYNEYFDIPYPLPTLDLIAIPDFESAAMENWGAVTFRETAILVDDEHTSLSNKQWAAIVIAHELAHQWFGNLVTMHWWTDLWLNEGFATYMETFCVDHLFPDWHMWDLYLSDRYATALKLDSLANSHPIEVEVHHPDEISEVFDAVSYAKGGAVIRMIAEYIGDDKFRDGLRHYLKKHSYGNTNTVDLWSAFEKVSKKPIKKIMNSWTKKTGYPLVTISQRKVLWEINQERFFSSRIEALKYKNNKKHLWEIPISYEANKEIQKMLLTKLRAPLVGTSIGKVNKEEGTFIRVRYDRETLKNLKNEIQNDKLSVKDRLGIIRDLFALAEGGYISTAEALEFSLIYKHETEYIVWSEIASGINKIANIIGEEKWKSLYDKYVLSLFNHITKELGWNNKKGDKHSQIFLRSLALSMTAHYGNKKVITEAQKLFKNKVKTPINADIRGVIYNIIAANGGEKEWKLFEKLYKEGEMHEEKDRYARALTSFKDKRLLLKTLHFAISSHVRDQDAPFIIVGVWQNSMGKDITWKFIKNNWKIILKKFGEGGHFLSRVFSPLGTHTKEKDLKDIKKFFAKNIAPGSARTLEQSYERIESNIAWLKDDKASIKSWLFKNY